MIWFCSDNGPTSNNAHGRSTGGLAGQKRSLKDGGVCVPGLMIWPARIKGARVINAPASTCDYFPTILASLNIPLPTDREYDGINLLPLIEQKVTQRNKGIGFLSQKQQSWMGEKYKIYSKNGKNFQLYDLSEDRGEKTDLSDAFPEVKAKMLQELAAWKEKVYVDLSQCEAVDN